MSLNSRAEWVRRRDALRPGALTLLGVLAIIAGCTAGPQVPDATEQARTFWEALARSDHDAAAALCVPGSKLPDSGVPALSRVSVSPAQATSVAAQVPTWLELAASAEADPDPVEITTWLERKDPGAAWRVDCTRTLVQLTVRTEVDAMRSRMQTLSEALTGELERGTEQLKRTLPGVQEELEREFGRAQQELREGLPEFLKRIEDFADQVEAILKGLPLPDAPPSEQAPGPPSSTAPSPESPDGTTPPHPDADRDPHTEPHAEPHSDAPAEPAPPIEV